MKSIPASSLYQVIEKLLRFPFPQICRHSVACDLLCLLDQNGEPISEELAKAVVEADDEMALKLLNGK